MLAVGDQIILNSGAWAIVEEVSHEDGICWVVDKHGQDHEIGVDGSNTLAKIDTDTCKWCGTPHPNYHNVYGEFCDRGCFQEYKDTYNEV